ncbi:MAG: hypothetical protein FJY77_03525 [Candidatus Altiarchaeales archaeon]|nr:hypothetical protein [Candidatus Altiarchaeales archaeon]
MALAQAERGPARVLAEDSFGGVERSRRVGALSLSPNVRGSVSALLGKDSMMLNMIGRFVEKCGPLKLVVGTVVGIVNKMVNKVVGL